MPEIRTLLAALSGMPKEIDRLTRGCTVRQLHHKPNANAWSAREILAHLRACAEVWGRTIERMIAEDQPTIRYVSPRGWLKRTDYLQQSFHDSLEHFTDRRARLIEMLDRLDAPGWSRSATFTATTQGHEATVFSYARRIADHEAQHLAQIRRTITG